MIKWSGKASSATIKIQNIEMLIFDCVFVLLFILFFLYVLYLKIRQFNFIKRNFDYTKKSIR